MRHEFYGDRKDVAKWSFLLETAWPRRRILQVTMLRPNEDRGHGHDFADSQPSVPDDVARFFNQERQLFTSGVSRDLSRICGFSDKIEPPIPELYEHGCRDVYFQRVVDRLISRVRGRKYVVFLDPDNGIAGKVPRSKHVCPAQIRMLWDNMEREDILVIYQHQFRHKLWKELRGKVLAEAISVCEGGIEMHLCSASVCFYRVRKP